MTGRQLTSAQLVDVFGASTIEHSCRFRRVCTGYPHAVAVAYDRDLERAAADTDEQVAAAVARWESANGVPVRDWAQLGRDERDDEALP